MKGATITVSRATRRYKGVAALENVTFEAPAGGVTALLGPSGSGKSTLLRLVAGLEPLDEGEIRLGEELVSSRQHDVPPEERGVGVVFQDYALFPHMTVLQNVAFGLAALDRPTRQQEANTWLERINLSHRAAAYPHALSGGEQQRVALARALAPKPRAVLLDEPFSGLDPMLRTNLRDITIEAIKAAGATAIFVTHDADEALYVSDRLAILRGGRLVQAGAPREVYDRPTSVDAAAALGPINLAQGRARNGMIETPFGAVPAPGMVDGAPAIVAVRAEAVRLQPGRGATVIERRPQGPLDFVRLSAGGIMWRALAPYRSGPGPGEDTMVVLDPKGAFAFPAS